MLNIHFKKKLCIYFFIKKKFWSCLSHQFFYYFPNCTKSLKHIHSIIFPPGVLNDHISIYDKFNSIKIINRKNTSTILSRHDPSDGFSFIEQSYVCKIPIIKVINGLIFRSPPAQNSNILCFFSPVFLMQSFIFVYGHHLAVYRTG